MAAFKARHGHLNVPKNYFDYDAGLDLGTWAGLLLREHDAKQKNPQRRSQVLTERRAAVLGAMGFPWGKEQPKEMNNYHIFYTAFGDSVSWNEVFLYRCSAHPLTFLNWAKQEVSYLEACEEATRVGLSPLCFPDYEISFRIALLKLTMQNIREMLSSNL